MVVFFTARTVADIKNLVGAGAYQRGATYQRDGRVLEVRWDGRDLVLEGRVRGQGGHRYSCAVYFDRMGTALHLAGADCTCPVGVDCKHAAATLLEAGELAEAGALAGARSVRAGDRAAAVPAWKAMLDRLPLAPTVVPGRAGTTRVGLQVRVNGVGRSSAGPCSLTVRPVEQGAKGGWSSTYRMSWSMLAYGGERWEPQAHEWLRELAGMRGPTSHRYTASDWEDLSSFTPRLLWPHLARAVELGVPIVGSSKKESVEVAATVRTVLGVGSTGTGLRLTPRLEIDGDPVTSLVAHGAVGDRGLFVLTDDGARRTLHLGPSPERVTDLAVELLDAGVLTVPDADAGLFWTDYHPRLSRHVTVVSADDGVVLPEPVKPTLVVRASFDSPTTARLAWSWEYPSSSGPVRHPVDAPPTDADVRDLAAEDRLRAEVDTMIAALPSLSGLRPRDQHVLTGPDALDTAEVLLPALEQIEYVRVDRVDVPEYTELSVPPSIRLSATQTEQVDWFDLGVSVEVDGRPVPLPDLLRALTVGEDRMVLDDGSWLRLTDPTLGRLRDLLDEAARLTDHPGRSRISKHQASLWGELEDLADVVEQSERWRESVGGLLALTTADGAARPEPRPAPSGLKADLRPYQQAGFEWLAFCYEHGLGGVLADDMGLGKTLQTLALVTHARENLGAAHPFLVVAPASVVSNWAAEAARFAPGLRVAMRDTTAARAAAPLADVAADADVVVTSFAIFRIDFESFEELGWSGLVLDEAQFVKNYTTRGNACARLLRAPFKLAITGTPMENDVSELWALLAIVAPGLFPSRQRFREDYVKPLEAASKPGADAEARALATGRVAVLRRRVRPLLLRRTKEQVAPELPERQEQVLSVELAPKHRRAYDARLQRERTRVLGLLDDFESNRIAIFTSLTTLRRMALDASLVDAQAHAGVPSSKLDVLFEQLAEVVAEGHRALVFSQFTSYLSLVAERCREQGVEFAYLDGTTRRRADVIRGFKEGTAPLFLVSLKAGGFGLNLTEADYVYLLDPWWNPATEAQAVDRTHRIGQTRNVMVFRLVAAGTIEEKVMELKERKARLVGAVLGDGEDLFSESLSADDVRGLFDADA